MEPSFRKRLRLRLQYRVHALNLKAADAQSKVIRALTELLGPDENRKSELGDASSDRKSQFSDAQIDSIYRNTGMFLSVWSVVESSIIQIVSILLECDPDRIGTVLYLNVNFGIWLDSVSNLIDSGEDSSLRVIQQKKWRDIEKKLRRFKDVRDRLAHHTALRSSSDRAPAGFQPNLAPNNFDQRPKSLKHSADPLTAEQIKFYIDNLGLLVDQIGDFTEELLNLYKLRRRGS